MTVQEIIVLQRGFKQQLAEQPIAYRIHKLNLLRKALKGEWQQKLVDAMRTDFGKGEVETRLTEILPTLDNIKMLTNVTGRLNYVASRWINEIFCMPNRHYIYHFST